jgi:hypothetical protein
MARFSLRVVRSASQPAEGVAVMISYHGVLGGHDEKRTDSHGWVELSNVRFRAVGTTRFHIKVPRATVIDARHTSASTAKGGRGT